MADQTPEIEGGVSSANLERIMSEIVSLQSWKQRVDEDLYGNEDPRYQHQPPLVPLVKSLNETVQEAVTIMKFLKNAGIIIGTSNLVFIATWVVRFVSNTAP